MVLPAPPQLAPPMPGPMAGPMPPQPAALMPGPSMPMIDPMMGGMGGVSLLNDPMVLATVLMLMAEQDQQQRGPVYARWYEEADYPKPKAADVEAKARLDRSLYRDLVKRFGEDRAILLLMNVGMFPDVERDSEATFLDPSLAQDRMLVVNLVATTESNYQARARRLDEKEIAEKKEMCAHAFRDQEIRRHERIYGTSLEYDEANIATATGHLCARLSLDFDAESDQFPVKSDLLDPATCFPTWDNDRGLRTMTRIYQQTVESIAATWRTPDGKKAAKKLLSKTVKDDKGVERLRTLDDTVEVVEYWDRRWYAVTVEGEAVIIAEHKFGFVPFVYLRSPFGDAGPVNLSALDGARAKQAGHELAMKGLSHIWASKQTHSQREAIMGRLMTELKKTANPPRTFEQAPGRYGETPDISNAEGGVTLLLMGEERETPTQPYHGYALVQPLMGVINEGVQRSMLPASAYGLTQNANESGSAIEGLNESGRDKLTAWLVMLQEFDRAKAEMAMRLYRDWGYMLGSDGRRGEIDVPRLMPKPDQDAYVTITPEEIRQVGTEIQVKRTSLRLANLAALGNGLSVWKANGWLEDHEALEMRGVRDPIAALERIEIQELMKQDMFKPIRLIKILEKQGDYESAAMVRAQLQRASAPQGGGPGGGGPPPGPGGAPGAGPGAPPGQPMGPQGAPRPDGAMGMPSRLPGPPPGMMGPPPGSLA